MQQPTQPTWATRDKATIWHPYTQMQTALDAITIVKGEGVWLIDEDGNRYLDGISSWWVNTHGHANSYIAQRVSEQLHTLEHVIFAGFTHPNAVLLAERLLGILPKNQSKIFYSDNGSTAVEVALKMALQYFYNRGEVRTKVIAFENAYHGDTFGAMAVSGRSVFTAPFDSFLFDVQHLPVPIASQENEAIQFFENYLNQHTDKVAAFIFEPLVQGAGGMIMYSPEALDKLLLIAKKHGVLCIADEVMTGFGRTGKAFASNHFKEQPDLICLSKGLTGGTMPLGITTCAKAIYEAFLSESKTKTLFHGHSFTANPLACVAALASLDLLQMPETNHSLQRIQAQHESFACMVIKKYASLKDIRICGTVLALEIENSEQTSYLNPVRDHAYQFFLDRKILLRPLGNVIYVLPPYCISETELAYIHEQLEAFLQSL